MKKMWPFRHFGLKVWSVLLAIMLWMLVAGEETVERGLRVPLELQQFPAGLELQQGEPPSLVDVRIRGSSGTLGRLGPGDIVAVLDLRSARPGRRVFQLTPEQVRTPFGVQVVQVTPATITLGFENSAVRHVPVVPAVEGTPAPGFVVATLTSDPKTVEIVGPESSVKRATEALTEPVSVDAARRDITDSVSVGFMDPALRLKTPRLVTVTVQIVPGPEERAFRDRPVRLRGLTAGLSAQAVPPAVDVVLRGTGHGLSRVDPDSVSAYVDLTNLGVGEYTLNVHVDAPDPAGVARINPVTVQVRIARAKR